MASVLRVLSDFGDAAGWLVAAVVVVYFARHLMRENERAHAELRDAVKANADSIGALRGEVRALRGEVHAIATDVAVLRDRAERPSTESSD